MIETIEFQGDIYPKFQSEGFAAQFAMPFFKHFCKGDLGVDVGCNREEWKFPGSIMVDPAIDSRYDALNFPNVLNPLTNTNHYDWIASSHCLEHLNDWTGVLNYWWSKIRYEGVIFLYLPDYSQKYWRPWNNRKHVNVLTPEILRDYFESKGASKIFVSGVDLNNSFYVVAEK